LGLGWLFANSDFGGAMGGIIVAMLGVMVLFALLRLYGRQREAAAKPMQYAGMGGAAAPTGFGSSSAYAPSNPVASTAPASAPTTIPAGFDVAGFVKQAKINFLKLQEANDQGNVGILHDVCTPEMASALEADIRARHFARQTTEIEGLEASLLEVVTEGAMHYASVSFSGMAREETGGPLIGINEIWHLQKPVSGETGWLLAGIQQVS
jgi:predicted lipid-binding transport protein (Tim44 family)